MENRCERGQVTKNKENDEAERTFKGEGVAGSNVVRREKRR